MSGYIDTSYLESVYTSQKIKNIASVVGTKETYDTAKISRAIVAASALADSYIRERYTTPIVTPPEDFKMAVARIAYRNLMSEDYGDSEKATQEYEWSLTYLEKIQKKIINLDVPPRVSGASTGIHYTEASSPLGDFIDDF